MDSESEEKTFSGKVRQHAANQSANPGTTLGKPYELLYMIVSLNYCSQNGGNVYRAPYYHGNPNIGPRIIGNLNLSPYTHYGNLI